MAPRRITISTSSPQAPEPAHPTHTMGTISALPENLLREVFSRVGSIVSLFMLAVTCRGWLGRFTDPAFLREMLCSGQLQEGDHRARLLGIFLQDAGFDRMDGAMRKARMAQRASAFSPTFLPAPGSPLGLAGSLASMVAADDGTFNYAEPLSARRGIVLMHRAPRTAEEDMGWQLFGICNPVTGGDCHVLPPLEWQCSSSDYDGVRGYAIVTAGDRDLDGTPTAKGRFAFSQLLVITKPDRGTWDHYYLHSYTTATRRWSTHTRCLDGDRYSLVGERSAVVHQGAAHWLCIDDADQARRGDAARCEDRLYKLSVEVATGDISLTKLPVRGGGKPVLCVTKDGELALASVYHAHVCVWTQPAGAESEDGGAAAAAAWPRTSFRIPPAVPEPKLPWQSEEVWCNFGQGSILARYRSGGVFIVDLHKKVMEKAGKVMDCNPSPWVRSHDKRKLKRVAYIAYEMDLVEFFKHQLGGPGRGGLGLE